MIGENGRILILLLLSILSIPRHVLSGCFELDFIGQEEGQLRRDDHGMGAGAR
jgi:hypothetical protein